MKTPISYYGGKQNMLKHILPMIPVHEQYVEPFFGGGAVFFAKPRSRHEVINDIDNRVVNFYEVLKNNFKPLNKKIQSTMHSESSHRKAREILLDPNADKINLAWAFWMQCNMSFGHRICGGFSFGNDAKQPLCTYNMINNMSLHYPARLELVEIFCRDAINLIKLKDGVDTFFYLDPPYMNADQGHYKGYTPADYNRLLETLAKLKGKFLLSSYWCENTKMFIEKKHWNHKKIVQPLTASKCTTGKRKMKTEVLTWNYN